MDKIGEATKKMGDSLSQGVGRTQHSGHAGTDAATNRGNEVRGFADLLWNSSI
jgi:hypothetical protein